MNRHEGVICNGCMKSNFVGRCYRCLSCRDFDLCSECYQLDVTTGEHLFDHPMKCLLTPADAEMYFGGEYLNGEPPQSYRCPYCKRWGFNESTFLEHITDRHPNASPDLISHMVTLFEQQQAARIFLEEEQLSAFVATAAARNRMISRQVGLELTLEPLNPDGSYIRVNREHSHDAEIGTIVESSNNNNNMEDTHRNNGTGRHNASSNRLPFVRGSRIPRAGIRGSGGGAGGGSGGGGGGDGTNGIGIMMDVTVRGGVGHDGSGSGSTTSNVSDNGRTSGQSRNSTRRQNVPRSRQQPRPPPLQLNLPTIPEYRRTRPLDSDRRLALPERSRIAPLEMEHRLVSSERQRPFDVDRRYYFPERPMLNESPEHRASRLRHNELERRLTDRLRLSLSEVDNRRLNLYMSRGGERIVAPQSPQPQAQTRSETNDTIGALMRFYGDSISHIFNESHLRSSTGTNSNSTTNRTNNNGRPRVRIVAEPVTGGSSGSGSSGTGNGNGGSIITSASGSGRSGRHQREREGQIPRTTALIALAGDDRYTNRMERRAERQRNLRLSSPYYSRFLPAPSSLNMVNSGTRERDTSQSSQNNRNVVFLSAIEDELRMVENLRIGSSAENISIIDGLEMDSKLTATSNERKYEEHEKKQYLLRKFLKSSEHNEAYPIFLANRAEFVSQLLMSAMGDDELVLPDKLVDDDSATTIHASRLVISAIYPTPSDLRDMSAHVLDQALATIEPQIEPMDIPRDIDIDSISELEITTDDEEE